MKTGIAAALLLAYALGASAQTSGQHMGRNGGHAGTGALAQGSGKGAGAASSTSPLSSGKGGSASTTSGGTKNPSAKTTAGNGASGSAAPPVYFNGNVNANVPANGSGAAAKPSNPFPKRVKGKDSNILTTESVTSDSVR